MLINKKDGWFNKIIKRSSMQALLQVLIEMRKPGSSISSAMEQYGTDITEMDLTQMKTGSNNLNEIDMQNLNAIDAYVSGNNPTNMQTDQPITPPIVDQGDI